MTLKADIRKLAELAGGLPMWDETRVSSDTDESFLFRERALQRYTDMVIDMVIKECANIAAGERSGWEARKAIEEQSGIEE
jgi:hypothetical protein